MTVSIVPPRLEAADPYSRLSHNLEQGPALFKVRRAATQERTEGTTVPSMSSSEIPLMTNNRDRMGKNRNLDGQVAGASRPVDLRNGR